MSLRIGSLFSGYLGLDMAIKDAIGGETTWVSDVCKINDDGTVGHHDPCRAPCTILAHRAPEAPNLGDVTQVDWATVPRVDVLAGGFPCTDVSSAGRRAGLRPGTRSGLWAHMAYAIEQLQPRLVVIENVRGLTSASAHSDVEPCSWCLGDDPDGYMRALGAVLADLADLGYDAVWCGLRASDVGAPHGRFRIFIVAYPTGQPWGVEHGDSGAAADTGGEHGQQWRLPTPGQAASGRPLGEPAGRSGELLPTPTAARYGNNRSASDGAAVRHGLDAIDKLLPTPRATDGTKGGPGQRGSSGDLMLPSAVALLVRQPERWGKYAPAIRHWEALTRPAPAPTQPSRKGNPQLAPAFSEWMMGLPAGWVGDVPGITRNEALKALGNGVVPQQGAEAIRWCLAQIEALGGAA